MGTIITKKRVKGEQITIETPVVAATFAQTVPPFEHSEGYTPSFEDSATSFDIDPRTFNFAPKTQAYYLQEFVQHIPDILVGLMAKEVSYKKSCWACPKGNLGCWGCRDCFSPKLLCRLCMRGTHLDNPLHRIEAWTGEYFRTAELWEVGCYVVVPHAGDVPPICQTLEVQMVYLESFQRHSDSREQNFLREQDTSSPGSLGSAGPAFTHIKTPATDNRGNPATSKGNGTPSPLAKATVESGDVPYDMPGNAPSPMNHPVILLPAWLYLGMPALIH
ncbi:hypothetical protein DXG01_000675 [Tephrocybe rancida]|nr:hypothetical protein DXG01_000675 [Tephrocybe rancida]